jgi:hypothetical protein
MRRPAAAYDPVRVKKGNKKIERSGQELYLTGTGTSKIRDGGLIVKF